MTKETTTAAKTVADDDYAAEGAEDDGDFQ